MTKKQKNVTGAFSCFLHMNHQQTFSKRIGEARRLRRNTGSISLCEMTPASIGWTTNYPQWRVSIPHGDIRSATQCSTGALLRMLRHARMRRDSFWKMSPLEAPIRILVQVGLSVPSAPI